MGESSAFEEICDRYYDNLITHVLYTARKYGELRPEEGLVVDAVTTALVNYRSRPAGFKPEKASLLTYLKMSAAGDYLNLVAKRRRAHQHVVEKDEEFWNRRAEGDEGEYESLESLEPGNSLAQQVMNHCVKSDEDRLVFEMVVDKIRDTKTCLEMLDWPPGSESTDRLRKAKERIDKCIKRAGQRLHVEET
jgi:DNA-directed RNA polymerase specialized sigma24 family protein